MYATTKRMAMTCAILTMLNLLTTAMCVTHLSYFELGIAEALAFMMMLGSTALMGLFLTIGLYKLCYQLDLEYESTAGSIHDLEKRVKKIENQSK